MTKRQATSYSKEVIKHWLFILSGLLVFSTVLFSPPSPLLMYPLFVLVRVARKPLSSLTDKIPLSASWKFIIYTALAGYILEIVSWMNNFFQKNPSPTLLHPQLIPNLILASGLYFPWALTWIILFKKYRFSFWQVVITQGLFGVLLEQRGAVFIQGLMTMPLGLIFWAYVFIAYGFTMGAAYTLFEGKLPQGQSNSWIKYPLALIAITVITMVIFFSWGFLVNSLGIIPKPGSIVRRPFW